jgi:hypothetical protein
MVWIESTITVMASERPNASRIVDRLVSENTHNSGERVPIRPARRRIWAPDSSADKYTVRRLRPAS